MGMDGMEQMGAMIGAAAAAFVAVLGPLAAIAIKWARKASSSEVEKIGEQVRKVLVGQDDATPKNLQDDTGIIKLAMRSELEPMRREQSRQGKLIEKHGRMLELLADGHQNLEGRVNEISGRQAKAEIRAEVKDFSERLTITQDGEGTGT